MHPKLGEWGSFVFYSYGTCLVLAAPLCLAVLALLLRRRKANLAAAVDLSTLALLGYWMGARLLYGVMSGRGASLSGGTPGAWGGQLAFGALAGAYLLGARQSFRTLSDALAVGWAALTVPVKVGCFLAGCCSGAPTSMPWGVRFPEGGFCAMPGVAVHPTQLYDAGSALLIAVALGAAFWRRAQEGRLLLWFGLAYASTKLASELFRGDRRFPVAGSLTASMALEAAVGLVCLLLLVIPGLWRIGVERLEGPKSDPEIPGAPPGRGQAFVIEAGTAVTAFLAAFALGAGKVWPARAFAAYVGVFLGVQVILAWCGRLVDRSSARPGAGRVLARGLIQALCALTILEIFRPLFDRAGRTPGDVAAETRLISPAGSSPQATVP